MCDTFVALPSCTGSKSILFGKNSDREPNEAQSLEYHPAMDHPPQSRLKCTYIDIPQAGHTNAVLLSRPFWMWGAEIGANENGVVIGNEAVWSKIPLNKNGGLTGMDLLRLALERGSTAETALETITELLAEYGQGGECGYEARGVVYHNSYIIADRREAWVLETAGQLWAALRVKDYYAISNGLTIGADFQHAHPELINNARRKGWLKKGQEFNFSTCYSDWFYTTFSASLARRSCSMKQLSARTGELTVAGTMAMLRDHGSADYRPDNHFLMNRVCAHAANPIARHAAQSTGSMVAELNADQQTFWATGTSAPCTSFFKPYRFSNGSLPDLGAKAGKNFDENNLWWRHELLHRALLEDFIPRVRSFRSERDKMEEYFISKAAGAGSEPLTTQTADAFNTAARLEQEWLNRLKDEPSKNLARWYYRLYWKKQNRSAGFPK